MRQRQRVASLRSLWQGYGILETKSRRCVIEERGQGAAFTERERAARHFGVAVTEVTPEMINELPPRGTGLDEGNARGILPEVEIDQVAEAIAEKIKDQLDIRDVALSGAMGPGAIPLYGRETRKETCSCCLINPDGPNTPENRMCTTSGAIGTLKDSEERDWCSTIEIVPDGRCDRAMKIREAAAECKEKYSGDTTKFFECYAPAFSRLTE